jgi:hypothetical protein
LTPPPKSTAAQGSEQAEDPSARCAMKKKNWGKKKTVFELKGSIF